jgi:hypothetical protein
LVEFLLEAFDLSFELLVWRAISWGWKTISQPWRTRAELIPAQARPFNQIVVEQLTPSFPS